MMLGHGTNEKLNETILYILSKCQRKPNLGSKVLAKLLYFSDFNYYKKYKMSITGEQYRRADFGPLASNFTVALESLQNERKIDLDRSGTQHRFTVLELPKIELLNENELQELDATISRLSDLSGNEIEELSHNETPWQVTDKYDLIDYDLVFYPNPKGIFNQLRRCDSEYHITECSDFSSRLEILLRKFKRTFDKDYDLVMKVILEKLRLFNDYSSIPLTKQIQSVGSDINFPILETMIYVSEVKSYAVRLIYLLDKDRQMIFLIDVTSASAENMLVLPGGFLVDPISFKIGEAKP